MWMNSKLSFALAGTTIIFLLAIVYAEQDDDLDPFDMVNFDHASMKMTKIPQTHTKNDLNENQVLATNEQTVVERNSKDTDINRNQEKDRGVTSSAFTDRNDITETDKGPTSSALRVLDTLVQSQQSQKYKKEPEPENNCPALSLFQQIVTVLLKYVRDKVTMTDEKEMATELCLHMSLTPLQLDSLESFKRDPSKGQEFVAHEVLNQAIKGARVLKPDDPLLRKMWLEERLGITVWQAIQLAVLLVLAVFGVILLSHLRFSWNLVYWMFLLVFVVSAVMTWYRMYKGEVAKRYAMKKDLPQGCIKLEKEGSLLHNLFYLYKYYFTFQKDECVAYYEHLIVDPIVKVSPMEAVAVALVQTLMKPLRTVGSEFSEFMRALLKDLPVQWQLVSVIVLCVFITLILLLTCGYRFRVPFLLIIEPAHNAQNTIAALQNKIQSLQTRLEVIGAVGNNQQRTNSSPPPFPGNSFSSQTGQNMDDDECLQSEAERVDENNEGVRPSKYSGRSGESASDGRLESSLSHASVPCEEDVQERKNHCIG